MKHRNPLSEHRVYSNMNCKPRSLLKLRDIDEHNRKYVADADKELHNLVEGVAKYHYNRVSATNIIGYIQNETKVEKDNLGVINITKGKRTVCFNPLFGEDNDERRHKENSLIKACG